MTEEPKHFITIDDMLIIGKYFESSVDYVNVMRVCRKYHDLVKFYHFNPISDTTLFERMESQHLYSCSDKRIEGMYQYIYWYSTHYIQCHKSYNDVIKLIHPYKYVVNNIKMLEEWCGHQYNTVLYDSDVDSSNSFVEKVEGHEHLYFIVIDDENDVFGHYHDGVVYSHVEYDKGIFLFTLNSNGRCGVMKYTSRSDRVNTVLCRDGYYCCQGCGFGVMELNTRKSYISKYITKYFSVDDSTVFTDGQMDEIGMSDFVVKRVVVIGMK